MQTVTLFDLAIVAVPQRELIADLLQQLTVDQVQSQQNQSTLVVATPNPEQIVLATKHPTFAQALHQATYRLPDGVGLVWASWLWRIFGKIPKAIPERIAGVDVVEQLMAAAAKKNVRTLIIGGRDYVGGFTGEAFEDEKSLRRLSEHVFWTEGYQEKADILPVEEVALTAIIQRLRPALVCVALGAPDQELWLQSHRQLLERNQVRIAMAVGGSFDFLFGKVARAPKFWQRLGVEWLWRLLQQPWRRRRQVQLIRFIWLTIRGLFR